jgi:protein-S-isoprenylcysteine O-methyltransferase Ste14
VKFLELKIPPPAVALLVALAMWGLAPPLSLLAVQTQLRVALAVLVALLGFVVAFSGVVSFRRAKTTITPLKPETASALVTSGVYRYTRNPMYLGLTAVLLGWALFLASAWALLGPLLYVVYITRFQIIPEERALLSLFGRDFSEYQQRVRRWL